MARRKVRKAGRKQKPGPRTKSGRLPRAYKSPELRNQGTRELQTKRLALVNDPQMSASAAGILFANGVIDADQRDAALRYGWAHALTYGNPTWFLSCALIEPGGGPTVSDMTVAIARHKLKQMDGRLDQNQRLQVANVACFNALPNWWMAAKLRLRQMPEDEREREALLSGLTALAGLPRAPIRVVQQEERTEPDGSAEPGSAVGDYHTVAMVRLTAK